MYYRKENLGVSLQRDEEILKIVEEAKVPPHASRSVSGFGWGGEEDGDFKEEDVDEEEEEEGGGDADGDEYVKSVKQAQASGEFQVS